MFKNIGCQGLLTQSHYRQHCDARRLVLVSVSSNKTAEMLKSGWLRHLTIATSIKTSSTLQKMRSKVILVYNRTASTREARVVHAIDGPRACHPIPLGETALRFCGVSSTGSIVAW